MTREKSFCKARFQVEMELKGRDEECKKTTLQLQKYTADVG